MHVLWHAAMPDGQMKRREVPTCPVLTQSWDAGVWASRWMSSGYKQTIGDEHAAGLSR